MHSTLSGIFGVCSFFRTVLEPKRKKRKLGHVIEGNETEAVAPGTLVAVRMSTMDVEWMMCKIVKFYPDEKEYTLRDIDEDSARYVIIFTSPFRTLSKKVRDCSTFSSPSSVFFYRQKGHFESDGQTF